MAEKLREDRVVTEAGRIHAARLANLDDRLAAIRAEEAQLLSERARVFRAMSEGVIELPGTAPRSRHVPTLPQITDTDRALARRALAERTVRRRVGR